MNGSCDVRLGEARTDFRTMSERREDAGLVLYVQHFHAQGEVLLEFVAGTGFSTEELTRVKQGFQALLEDVLERPEVPLRELRLMADTEQRRLLMDFHRTQAAYPEESCVHQLFDAQAQRTPHAPALCFDDGQREETLTYRQLDERANQLAHALRSRR